MCVSCTLPELLHVSASCAHHAMLDWYIPGKSNCTGSYCLVYYCKVLHAACVFLQAFLLALFTA